MPRPRFNNLAPERQASILEAAASEFALQGFEGASYNQIIEKTGISKGAMYYYFDDKADLYATVVRRVMDQFLRDFGELPPTDGPEAFWEMVERLVIRMMNYSQENPTDMGILRSLIQLHSSGVMNASVHEMYGFYQSFVKRMLRQGQEVRAVRTDLPFDLMVNLLIAVDHAIDIWMVEHWEELSIQEMERLGVIILDFLRRFLTPSKPPVGGAS